MRSLRRTIRFFMFISLSFFSAPASATTVLEQTFPDLVHRAEVIAVGTVTGIQEQWDAYVVPNFAGRNVVIQWQESLRNFGIIGTQ